MAVSTLIMPVKLQPMLAPAGPVEPTPQFHEYPRISLGKTAGGVGAGGGTGAGDGPGLGAGPGPSQVQNSAGQDGGL